MVCKIGAISLICTNVEKVLCLKGYDSGYEDGGSKFGVIIAMVQLSWGAIIERLLYLELDDIALLSSYIRGHSIVAQIPHGANI